MFINAYNAKCLEIWNSNMDIQYCPNNYAMAVYIVSYMCKGKKGLTKIMEQACKEAIAGNKTLRQQITQIGAAFFQAHQTSAQEAVYILLGLPMRTSSRSVIFVATGPKNERIVTIQSPEQIKHKDDNDKDVLNPTALVSKYETRPRELAHFCYADFASNFDQSTGFKLKPNDMEIEDDEFTTKNDAANEYEYTDISNMTTFGPDKSKFKRVYHKRQHPHVTCVGYQKN